jgi:hypothetical protein
VAPSALGLVAALGGERGVPAGARLPTPRSSTLLQSTGLISLKEEQIETRTF